MKERKNTHERPQASRVHDDEGAHKREAEKFQGIVFTYTALSKCFASLTAV